MPRQIELTSLHSALANIDGQLRTLEQSGRTPGEILVFREYYQRERKKVLLQIRLFGQQSLIEELEVSYKFSQTPGAQANYRRRVSLINTGRAPPAPYKGTYSIRFCTICVQFSLYQQETRDNRGFDIGGASRDRTDDLIVANDDIYPTTVMPTIA